MPKTDGPINCSGVRGATFQVYAVALEHTGMVRSGQKQVCFRVNRNALSRVGSRSKTAHIHEAIRAHDVHASHNHSCQHCAALYWPVPVANQRNNQIEESDQIRTLKAVRHKSQRRQDRIATPQSSTTIILDAAERKRGCQTGGPPALPEIQQKPQHKSRRG